MESVGLEIPVSSWSQFGLGLISKIMLDLDSDFGTSLHKPGMHTTMECMDNCTALPQKIVFGLRPRGAG